MMLDFPSLPANLMSAVPQADIPISSSGSGACAQRGVALVLCREARTAPASQGPAVAQASVLPALPLDFRVPVIAGCCLEPLAGSRG